MKKVLFATTALVASAGIAAADGHTSVGVSGYAEMGVVGGSGGAITQFFQDIDVRFALSGEFDGGLTFGANVDLDEVVGGATGATNNDFGTSVFLSGDFGTLTLGDTDGGFDAGMQEVNIGSPGSIADNETGHAGYNGNSGLDGVYDGQILSYRYSTSGFTIVGSVEMDDDATSSLVAGPFGTPALVQGDGLTGDAIYGIGASYAGDFGGGSFTVGGGFQMTGDTHAAVAGAQELSVFGVSATVALDMGLSAGVNYSTVEYAGGGAFADMEGTHTAIGASYAFDGITVHANYGAYDWDATALVADSEGFGLAAGYDLGAGLNLLIGYGSSEVTAVNGSTSVLGTSSNWSLGLAASF